MSQVPNDENLMAEVMLGKREPLEMLMRRYATPLLTFLNRMVGERELGEELFQDVFLTIWKKRHLYQYPRRFKSWLFAIAVNQCRTALRHASLPEVPWDVEVCASEEASPVDLVIATETASLVGRAVALLPPRQRAVVVLRIWQQLSYAEIAEITDTTEGSARASMHHGLNTLRAHLEPRLA